MDEKVTKFLKFEWYRQLYKFQVQVMGFSSSPRWKDISTKSSRGNYDGLVIISPEGYYMVDLSCTYQWKLNFSWGALSCSYN